MDIVEEQVKVRTASECQLSAYISDFFQAQTKSAISVVETATRGRAVVAIEDIKEGTVVLQERALLTAPDSLKRCIACGLHISCQHSSRLEHRSNCAEWKIYRIGLSYLIPLIDGGLEEPQSSDMVQPLASEQKMENASLEDGNYSSEDEVSGDAQLPLRNILLFLGKYLSHRIISDTTDATLTKLDPAMILGLCSTGWNEEEDSDVKDAISSLRTSLLDLARGDVLAKNDAGSHEPKRQKKIASCHQNSRRCSEIIKNEVNVAFLFTLASVLSRNAIENQPDGGGAGTAVFPLAAMLNHSCYENCCFSTNGRGSSMWITVTTLKPLSRGQELTISYCDPYLPQASRQAALESLYKFVCDCCMCLGEKPDKCRAFVCSALKGGTPGNSGCGGVVEVWGDGSQPSQWRCNSDVAEVGGKDACLRRNMMPEDVAFFLSAEAAARGELSTEVCVVGWKDQEHCRVLDQRHYLSVQLSRARAQKFLENELADSKLVLSLLRSVVHACETVCGVNHPETALSRRALAEALVEAGMLNEALAESQECWRVFSFCFGACSLPATEAAKDLLFVEQRAKKSF